MIAYNNEWLHNQEIREAGKTCYDNGCLSQDEYKDLREASPVGFFTPNIFLRIGMLLLTLVCTSFMLGLFMMVFDKGYFVILIMTGLVCYAGLEFFIKEKQHYRSGVDDGLAWSSAIMVAGGLIGALSAGSIAGSFIVLIIATWFTLRFSDKLMAAAAFTSLISLQFFICSESGGLLKAIVPFVLMATSAIVYFIIKKNAGIDRTELYQGCLLMLEILSLSCFYLAGNYFVVRELSNEMFNLNLQEGESIPFGFLFKFFTAAIPVFYVATGIKRKDIVMIRVGLFALAASILTVKYYNHFVSIEAAMTAAGLIIIAIAWFFTRYLQVNKHGYTYLEIPGNASPFKPLAESLVIAETFEGTDEIPEHQTEFGGGSFGGAGAGEKF